MKKNLTLYQKKEAIVFVLLAGCIFTTEIIILLIPRYVSSLAPWQQAMLDSAALAFLIFPLIYFVVVKPFKKTTAVNTTNETGYRSLIENIGEGVVICDANEKFIFANAAAEKLFGEGKGALIGAGLQNYFTKEQFAFIARQTKERIKGNAGEYESEIILKNGSKKIVSINATPRFTNGVFAGTLAIFRDISEIKKAEAAIKYERNLLRAVIDNLPDAVYVKNRKFQKIIANPADLKYMGFESEKQVTGKTDYEVYPEAVADNSFTDDLFVFDTGLPFINKEDYFIDNLNEEHWMLNSKVPIKDASGEIIGLVGIGRDITERKREETRLKLLESVITNTTDALVITAIEENDPASSRIIFVNNAFCKMTGYSLTEVIGKSQDILYGANTNKDELLRVNESLQKFAACKMEVINYRKNGQEFWSSISFSPITDNNGNYTHWIAIKRDVTEQKKLEQNYIHAKEKAEAASKAKSEFLANMSHEIRTPLNSVIGFSDLMMKTSLDETQQQYNAAVFQSATALLGIINEILDFSKIEAGKLEIAVDKTAIHDISNHVSDIICFQALKKNLELLLNVGIDVPEFIWADALRLKQILINLMSNAVKFTAVGEIELKIEVLNKQAAGKTTIRFSVSDTGIGINPKNQQKIFEAFSQEDASTSRRYGGTGLGLAISKKLLQLMGSELQLHSVPAKGSTFFFDLDVKTMQDDAVLLPHISACKKILITDDNASNRLLIKNMLAAQHIECDEAESGIVAVNMLTRGNKYDLILMDYNMPEMDGIETIKKIRNDLNLPAAKQHFILLHSPAEDERLNEYCTALEVSQKLVKPVRIKQLFEAIYKSGTQNAGAAINTEKQKLKPSINPGYFKVLIVDDNVLNIVLIKKIVSITLPNATIIEAKNGLEAVVCFTNELPDIVFMDVQMPEMNGNEATVEIRKMVTNKRVPVIALTAGTLIEEKEVCMMAGMDDFVTKPFVSSTIVDVINKWL
jgi:PAS domain S-box-containing protein